MSQREEKISKLLEFPYDAFLMIRLEYVQILNDELEAKLLRIIEKYVEQARKNIYQKMLNTSGTPPPETVDIAKDMWVPISYRLFMNDLFGTVTSENTVKRAIRDMVNKKIIFQRFEPKKKYDAPEYKIHVSVLQMLLNVLRNPGYQSLIPSIVDTLKTLPPQELTPSECQKLIPSNEAPRSNSEVRVSTIDPHIREGYENNITSITGEKERVFASAPTPSSHEPGFYHSIPMTYGEALAYLKPHGSHEGLDAVQVMALARKLWVEAHEDDVTQAVGETYASPPPILPARAPTLDSVPGGEPETEQPVSVEGEMNGQSSDCHRDKQHLPQHLASGPASGAAEHQNRATPPQRGHVRDTSGAHGRGAEVAQQMTSDLPPTDGAATERGSAPRASEAKEKPKRKKPPEVQLSLQAAQLKEWYEELRGVNVSFSKRNVAAFESLAKKEGTENKDMFLNVVALLDIDPWFEKNGIGVDPYWIERQWENKYIFLRRKKPTLVDKPGTPVDIYTANSMDKEKMRRRIEEMKARAAEKGLHLHGTN